VEIDELAAQVLAGPARLRGSRLVCIDGRAGAGKTLLAARLANQISTACAGAGPVTTVHMDDLYEGWDGLPGVADVVASQLVEPWATGEPALAGVWDWHHRQRLEPVEWPLTPVVILEGVGSWSQRIDDAVCSLIWLECDEPTRRRRALNRDPGVFDLYWNRWAADEEQVHGREQTRINADLVIDTGDQSAVALP